MQPTPSTNVEFGEFDFSFETLKLRKRGVEVRLVGQPLQLLMLLLQTPGKVVAREEIRARLWPETHVDFDHSVHAALNRLRAALGDNGKQPRFIETVPTIGYRFLAAVNVAQPTVVTPVPPARGSWRRVAWVALAIVLAALMTYSVVRLRYDKFVPRAGQSSR
jgi:DNA-binding winged helix-turn-helix (wHTH) protein